MGDEQTLDFNEYQSLYMCLFKLSQGEYGSNIPRQNQGVFEPYLPCDKSRQDGFTVYT